MKHSSLIAATCGIILAFPFAGKADTSFTINTTIADAFLSGGTPTIEFRWRWNSGHCSGIFGQSEFDSVIMFNPASAVSQFNTTYGAGNGRSPV